jgi:hypothetical protein
MEGPNNPRVHWAALALRRFPVCLRPVFLKYFENPGLLDHRREMKSTLAIPTWGIPNNLNSAIKTLAKATSELLAYSKMP